MTIENLYKIFLQQNFQFTTDTRKIDSGDIFFALKGGKFNANQFAQQALNAGAAYVVVDEIEFVLNEKCIVVNDALQSLQQLANHHRKQFSIPVIAIGGSNGKTTTKELVSKVLSEKYRVHTTAGNFNNHIGVPITLLKMPMNTEIAVIEIGANHLLETKLLCEIAEPDFGLITNNGKDHLEGFGNIEGVKKANTELFDYLKSIDATAFVNAGDIDLKTASVGLQQIFYSDGLQVGCFGSIKKSFPFLEAEIKINEEKFSVQSQLSGNYNLINIIAASCIGSYFKVSTSQIKRAVENYKPANNRSQWIEKNSNNFIVDCYNANPSSMKLALESFVQLPLENKVPILGDMFELGAHSAFEHQQIIQLLNDLKFENAILVGNEFENAKNSSAQFLCFKNVEELKIWFVKSNFSKHTFLLKGSRGMTLEKILE